VERTASNSNALDLANGTNDAGNNAAKVKTKPTRDAAAEPDKTKRVWKMPRKRVDKNNVSKEKLAAQALP
jgi:hypothetical protein